MPINIDILIPAYNEGSSIALALRSIDNQINTHNYIINVYVISNGSTDNTVSMVRNYIDRRTKKSRINYFLIDLATASKTSALNHGLKNSSSDYVAYMDADVTLEKDVIDSTFEELIDNKDTYLVGALDVPNLNHIPNSTMLYQIQKTQQIFREVRGRTIPCGRYMCFKRNALDKFPLQIHSEDTWLALHVAKNHGWGSVKVIMSTEVHFTPPDNWLDFIKQQARFERGYYQLMHKFPKLQSTWQRRRKHVSHVQTKEQVEGGVKRRLKDATIPTSRFEELNEIIFPIIEETCSALAKELITDDGKWDPIRSTKRK